MTSRSRTLKSFFCFTSLYWSLVSAPAFAMMGEAVVNWTASNIVVPLCVFSLLAAGASAVFKPEFAKGAVYVLMASIVLLFLMKSYSALGGLLQGS